MNCAARHLASGTDIGFKDRRECRERYCGRVRAYASAGPLAEQAPNYHKEDQVEGDDVDEGPGGRPVAALLSSQLFPRGLCEAEWIAECFHVQLCCDGPPCALH